MTRIQGSFSLLLVLASVLTCGKKNIDSDVIDPKAALFQFFEISPLGNACSHFKCTIAVRRMLFPSREPTILEEFYLDSKGEVHHIAKEANFEVLEKINMLQKGGEIEINARKFINAQKLQTKTSHIYAPEIGKRMVSIVNELSNQQPQPPTMNCIDGISGFIEYYRSGETQVPHFEFRCHPGKVAGAYKQIVDIVALFETEANKR